MIAALLKGFGQLTDPAARGPVWLSLLGALALLLGLGVALWFLVTTLAEFRLPWLDLAIDWGAGALLVVLAWLLFPVAVTAVLGLFLERVADATERRHYPELPPPREQSVIEAVWGGLRFGAFALALNLLALPLYAILLFFPPINACAFYGLNGYLLGREYFELVALRRFDPREARAFRRAHGGRLFVAGVIIAVMLTVPLFNLLAPVVATAFMLHLFEAMRRARAPL